MKQVIQDYNVYFWNFVKSYDSSSTNVLRKIIHSFDVATTCFKIACKLQLNETDRQFAYLIGLLHDVGRFEQWKLYQTYDDTKSVDHGDLSFEILKKLDCKTFGLSKSKFNILLQSIKYHNKPYHGLDEQILLFNEILRNSDAYSNVITVANGAQQMTVCKNGVSDRIYEKFINLLPLFGQSPNTKLDRALMLTANCYYVTYTFLREEILAHNYITAMFETFSKYLTAHDKMLFKQAIEEVKSKYLK